MEFYFLKCWVMNYLHEYNLNFTFERNWRLIRILKASSSLNWKQILSQRLQNSHHVSWLTYTKYCTSTDSLRIITKSNSNSSDPWYSYYPTYHIFNNPINQQHTTSASIPSFKSTKVHRHKFIKQEEFSLS